MITLGAETCQLFASFTTSFPVDDGSGNAPEMNCHFFLAWEDVDGQGWRYDLQDGLRVRLRVPTDDELRALPKWCEGMNWGNYPDQHTQCEHLGTRYLQPGGEHWYCPKHAPKGLEPAPDDVSPTLQEALKADVRDPL